jgi:hypothetical protein
MRQGYVGNDYLRMIDLNLFRVFNAMMELRSVVKSEPSPLDYPIGGQSRVK